MLPNETRFIPVDPDSRGFTDEFECGYCNCTIHLGYYIKRCDFEYCPWCGKKATDDEDSYDKKTDS